MKSIQITPTKLRGSIQAPPSKSYGHRAIIAAALAGGESTIYNLSFSDDILATFDAVKALGALATTGTDHIQLKYCTRQMNDTIVIDCKESGSTLRFMIPIALALGKSATYIGAGNLHSRPLQPYLDIFEKQGITYSSSSLPMTVAGRLSGGIFELPGHISSQFITGLMFALPLLEQDSTIHITTPLESQSYIDMTIDTLHSFGIEIVKQNKASYYMKGNQKYKAAVYTVEGDFSQAAFWVAAGVLGNSVTCEGLNLNSEQGDKAFVDILKQAGADICSDGNAISAHPSKLKGFHADVSQCPDIAPILAVIAAFSEGTSCIYGAQRLRIKESDRLKAISIELNKLGASVTEGPDSLNIQGKPHLIGGEVDSWGDHRIAMALSIASIKCLQPVIINNSHVVAKSYPNFYEDFKKLGGSFHEFNLG